MPDKVVIICVLLFAHILQAKQVNKTCHECIDSGHSLCLNDGSYTIDQCCTKDSNDPLCVSSKQNNNYCVHKDLITNQHIQKWACKSDIDKCPDKMEDIMVNINSLTKEYKRQHTFPFEVPNTEHYDIHCKYQINVD